MAETHRKKQQTQNRTLQNVDLHRMNLTDCHLQMLSIKANFREHPTSLPRFCQIKRKSGLKQNAFQGKLWANGEDLKHNVQFVMHVELTHSKCLTVKKKATKSNHWIFTYSSAQWFIIFLPFNSRLWCPTDAQIDVYRLSCPHTDFLCSKKIVHIQFGCLCWW